MAVQWNEQAPGAHGLRRVLRKAGSAARTARTLLLLSVVVSCAALTACQSDVDGIAKNVKTNDIKPPSSDVEESFGETGAEITLLMQKGSTGLYEGPSRDVRDAAALAVGELGANQAFVKVVDVSSATAVPAAIAAARSRNSALLVSYLPPATTAAVAAIPSDQRPALLNLGAAVPTTTGPTTTVPTTTGPATAVPTTSGSATTGNVYNFASSETDSAMEGVRAAFASGHRKVVVFAPRDLPPTADQKLADAIRASGGTFVGIARYDLTDASAAAAVQAGKPQLQAADTVLILGRTAITTTIEGAIKSGGQSNLNFVGTSAWPPQTYRETTANGTLIAMVEPEGASLISERYQRHYKRPLTTDAAYGYDAIAIASGIIRSKGAAGLNAETLTSKVGFRGVTGLFRLTPSGQAERRLSLYAISGGKLNVLAAAPASF